MSSTFCIYKNNKNSIRAVCLDMITQAMVTSLDKYTS